MGYLDSEGLVHLIAKIKAAIPDISGKLDVTGTAAAATKLATARAIDGMSFNGSTAITHYGTCATAAATAAKTVSKSGFSLVTGARIAVKFTHGNLAGDPTLNVNSTGAKKIYYAGTKVGRVGLWGDGEVVEFIYDGTNWILVNPSFEEGYGTVASGQNSHAEGYMGVASGGSAHVEGGRVTDDDKVNEALGYASHAEGGSVTASADYSHAEGRRTTASGAYSHAEGDGTTASKGWSHAEGYQTIASGEVSHTEGMNTEANELCAHAEGRQSIASGKYAHAEGFNAIAQGVAAHAEEYSTASGDYSHAEGLYTTASGQASHAEGTYSPGYQNGSAQVNSEASSSGSHVEGSGNKASGAYSHAEGERTKASGHKSHAGGYGTIAAGEAQTAIGSCNVESNSLLDKLIIGKGSFDGMKDTYTRANCFRVTYTGVYATGAHNTTGADYAELFEWEDGNPGHQDRAGLFVTLDGAKIRIAGPGDDYIVGIISGNPSVVGDVHDDQWQGMYLYDIFGRPIWEDVEVPAQLGLDGEVIVPAHTEHRQKLNPDFDSAQPYLPRSQRPEWDAVGMLGKLVAVDDGTCQVNGWCAPGKGGIAVRSEVPTRFRVMERLDGKHVRVLIL